MSHSKLRVNKGVSSPVKRRSPKVTQHQSTLTPDNGSGKNYSTVLGIIIAIVIIGLGLIVLL